MTTVKNPMSKLQIVEMQHDLRKERLQEKKDEIKLWREHLEQSLNTGSYSEAARWAEKIAEIACEVDTVGKELREFDSYLKFLKEDDCLRTPKSC